MMEFCSLPGSEIVTILLRIIEWKDKDCWKGIISLLRQCQEKLRCCDGSELCRSECLITFLQETAQSGSKPGTDAQQSRGWLQHISKNISTRRVDLQRIV
uniref:Uncharacterized protein n=1 Tax=Timema bartmani TaxID=61472 RepID=A0A7R9F3Q5_9NEOP|nr:unnamed protein product [Timema bartmani]